MVSPIFSQLHTIAAPIRQSRSELLVWVGRRLAADLFGSKPNDFIRNVTAQRVARVYDQPRILDH